MNAREDEALVRSEARRERAAGLLIGLAFADRWSGATEIALCVADAVATGLSLDDERALDLLRRNIRSRHETSYATAVDPMSDDAVLAACAVFAVAHHRDVGTEWDDALAAMLDVLEVPVGGREGLSSWANSIADVITSGAFDGMRLGQVSPWSTTLRAIARAGAGLEQDESSSPEDLFSHALSDESSAMQLAPAATGAFIGALIGAAALPEEKVGQLTGWPEADGTALINIAADVVAPRERGFPGVPVPTGIPSPDHDSPAPSRAEERSWRVVRVALTARDAQETR